MTAAKGRMAILVGGGPAPSINSAIRAVVIEAVNEGLNVIGVYDGFEHLIRGRTDMVRPLDIPDISRIHFQGGSILRTSRANPTRSQSEMANVLKALNELGISYLVTIGGDDTAYSASEVAKAAEGSIRVAHVPKTIDNDLPLPGGMPSFGFESARHVGSELVLNLMEDSRTTSRWFVAVVMGRQAGHLALGIGKAAGATLTIIPEEFPNSSIRVSEVCDIIEGSILKRRIMGHQDGLVVVAEGIGEKLDPEDVLRFPGVEVVHDQYGHLRLGEIPLATIIRRELQHRFEARGDRLTIVDRTLGYELRCAPPIPFDIDYTHTLGYGAVMFLLSPTEDESLHNGGLVCMVEGHLEVIPFNDLLDPTTGRTRVKLVDVNSVHYTVARKYMIRLERHDLEDDETRARLIEASRMTPQEFDARFAPVVGLVLR